MFRPNIGLDVDGVIYPWHNIVRTYYKMYHNYNGSDAYFMDYFNKALSVEEQKYIVSLPHLYDKAILSPSTKLIIDRLSEIGDLYYITARPESAIDVTHRFFEKSKLPFKENLVFSRNKAVQMRLNSISFYVDDNQSTIRELQDITTAFWFKVTWWEDKNDLPTVASLAEFLEIIERTLND